MQFQALSNITADPSVMYTSSTVNLLRILPDCISDPTVLYVQSPTTIVKGGEPNDLPTGIGTGGKVNVWESPIYADEFYNIPWENAIITDERTVIPVESFTTEDKTTADGWGLMDIRDLKTVKGWDYFSFADHLVSSAWNTMFLADDHRKIVYGEKTEITNDFLFPYKAPPPKDMAKKVSYDTFFDATVPFIFSWLVPGANDRHQNVPWGPLSYYPYCSQKYYPPDDGIVNFKLEKLPKNMIGVCYQVSFDVKGINTDLRCPYKHHRTGRRDPYISTGIEVKVIYPNSPQEVYRMMNLIYVKTVLTNDFIEVSSIDIKYDKQSWLWSFSLTVPKDGRGINTLALLKPTTNAYVDIEISINNWKWICRVEGWHESRVFAKDSWTIQGRSPSMELGIPMNRKTSYTFDPLGTGLSSGAQIIDAVLDGTILGIDNSGWTVDWTGYLGNAGVTPAIPPVISSFDPTSADDWGFPANSFSWVDLTQIEVIQKLVHAINGFIYTDPYCITGTKVLYVKPIVDSPPWNWNTPNVYRPLIKHAINTSYASEVGRSNESSTVYNAVYVMGQQSVPPQENNVVPGIPVVEVFRQGVGPGERIYAPDVTDPCITSWKAAVECGRTILSDTGEWIKHSIRLFSLETKDSVTPTVSGLIVPGDFVSVSERGTTWYGSVISTNIQASIVNRSAFAVSQTLEISEYIGN